MNIYFPKNSKTDLIYFWCINVMVYGIKKHVYMELEVFYFAHKKTLFFSKYIYFFLNHFFQKIKKTDFIYLWFVNVMVYGF